MKSSVAVRERERERENKRRQQIQKCINSDLAPAVCDAWCERAGHLDSAGDDTIDNSSKEEDQKKVKAKR